MRASLRTIARHVNRPPHAGNAVTKQPCSPVHACYRAAMADEHHPAALDRIERAIARIEAAAAAQAQRADGLARRHATLRARIGEAIAALDAVAEPAETA